jgi:hypothetical protein
MPKSLKVTLQFECSKSVRFGRPEQNPHYSVLVIRNGDKQVPFSIPSDSMAFDIEGEEGDHVVVFLAPVVGGVFGHSRPFEFTFGGGVLPTPVGQIEMRSVVTTRVPLPVA